MVNRCVVNGCTSGSVSNRNKHSKLGTKNPSLFTVPQHSDLLESWESELNQKLVPKKNYVCELHFNKEDIMKSDKIKTANGTIEELVRKRYALKQGAIPTLKPKKLSESRNTKDISNLNIPSTEPFASEPHNIVHINENCSQQDGELQIDEDFNSNYDRFEDFNSRISPEEINHENEELVYELPISEVNIEEFSLLTIVSALKFNVLPENWSWTTDLLDSKKLVLCYIDKVSMKLKFRVKINQNFEVWLTNIKTDKLINLNKSFSNLSDFWNFLRELEKYTLCDGTGFDTEKCSLDCTGLPLSHEEYKKQMNGFRCVACRKVRHKLQNQSYKTKPDHKERYDNLKYQESLKNKQIERLQRRNKLLKEIIDTQKANCLAIKDEALRAEISILPPIQQLAIRACFNAAKVSNPKQRRYTVQYIQKLDSAFGFPKAVFDTLRIKSGSMEVHAKRGTLLIDEVSLSEAIKLNRKTMQLDGFVNLGAHTPQNLQDTRADHALVFMFQPFQGDWVQVVGSFLSRNSVTSAILHKLLIECIILLENAGFFVDVITSDGAQWNRGAWTLFDFPHLIKCFRNKILEKMFFWLFSKDIQVAMKVYKNNTEELRDCDSTIAFIEKVNNLIQAMSSRTPAGALRSDPECPRRRYFNKLPWPKIQEI
ncbi:uncharacterized protein LOC141538438 isoform X3 [Cotesia typhae]|uniref:uncharacterized protein LOC141538438 isoform X3 n=1 Tax=Cotesia typhae TaxID=2053667 RepID=UPI003D68B857